MHTRLLQFLQAENISQSQFADSIGVARASVSHILAGRNKPGFDFIEGMLKHYPTLNVEWLISGKGKMYKSSDRVSSVQGDDLFGLQNSNQRPSEPVDGLFGQLSAGSPDPSGSSGNHSQPGLQRPNQSVADSVIEPVSPSASRQITKILVFYSDNTFAEIN